MSLSLLIDNRIFKCTILDIEGRMSFNFFWSALMLHCTKSKSLCGTEIICKFKEKGRCVNNSYKLKAF